MWISGTVPTYGTAYVPTVQSCVTTISGWAARTASGLRRRHGAWGRLRGLSGGKVPALPWVTAAAVGTGEE